MLRSRFPGVCTAVVLFAAASSTGGQTVASDIELQSPKPTLSVTGRQLPRKVTGGSRSDSRTDGFRLQASFSEQGPKTWVLERKIASGNYSVVTTVIAQNCGTYWDTNLKRSTTFIYRVIVKRAGRPDIVSNELQVRSMPRAIQAPFLVDPNHSKTRFSIRWQSAFNHEGFYIEILKPPATVTRIARTTNTALRQANLKYKDLTYVRAYKHYRGTVRICPYVLGFDKHFYKACTPFDVIVKR